MDKLHEESRKQFEEWWERECWDKKLENIQGVMFNRIKQGMFDSWLARQKSLVVELPEQKEDRARNCSSDDVAYGFNQGVGACAEAIRSIGLSIKGE